MSDRLSVLDAAFLEAEDADPHVSMAIASVAVLEGPAPTQEEFTAALAPVLAAIPRARQKVRRTPWDLGLPVWVDDPRFDPGYHFRRTALPAPGDDAALHRLVGRIMSQRLDREHPLWETWVIEGLAGGQWAVLTKVHHCLADGVSGAAIYGMIFGASTDPTPWRATKPRPAPAGSALLLGALVRQPMEQARLLLGALRSPGQLIRHLGTTAKGLSALAAAVRPAGPSSLSGPIGHARRYGVARASLPEVAATARTFGVTVNDMVLAAISGAFRTLLLHRGEHPHADTVRTLVPVSVRSAEDRGVLDNRVSLLLPFLPVDLADPVDALTVVHQRLARAKDAKEAEAGSSITALADHEPFAPIAMALRLAAKLPQRNIITVTTNVPGPRQPLSVLGRQVLELLPYVPIAARLRIGIAVLTYQDRMAFGITADYESAPEIDLLAAAVERTITELVAAARLRTAAQPPAPTRAR